MKTPLPNYFLADLPNDSAINAGVITDACHTLKRNRERYLAPKSTSTLIRLLSELGEQWLSPDYTFRQRALEEGPAATGFSLETLQAGLDGFFKQLNPDNLQALILQDLGSLQRLDTFAQTHVEIQERRSAWARGPELLVHVAAGNLPNPTLSSLVLGLLTRSAQFVKCARGASLIPRLFAHSLYDMEPKLAACLELAEWAGGSSLLDDALFAQANTLTATGSDEALAAIRSRLSPSLRFLGYGHRVSFAYLTAESLSSYGLKKLVQKAALDVSAWDQQGCLSPHVIYVEVRGGVSPDGFAELLADELQRHHATVPRGALSTEESAAIAAKRAFYEIRAAHSPETRIWRSADSTAWTVIYENDPLFQLSCLNRFIHVKAVNHLEEALRHAESVREHVSTVGLSASPEQAPEMALKLGRWGVTRICPVGMMQNPPLTWRHDGRPSLGDLVQWTDWEQ